MRKFRQNLRKKSTRVQIINDPPRKIWPDYSSLVAAILLCFFFQSQAILFYFLNSDNEEISPDYPEKIYADTNNWWPTQKNLARLQ